MKIKLSIELNITEKRLLKLGFTKKTEIKKGCEDVIFYALGTYKDDCGFYHDQIVYIPKYKNIINNHNCFWSINKKVETITDIKNFLKDIDILDMEKNDKRIYGNEGNFNIILKDAGQKRLAIIKEVRDFLKCDIRSAKDKIDNAPSILIKNVKPSDAYVIKNEFEQLGAIIDLNRI